MTPLLKCTCSAQQLNLVGCDCAAGYFENIERVWTADIANPGYGPIYAVHCITSVGPKLRHEWVLTDDRALFATYEEAECFADKVRARSVINPNYWMDLSQGTYRCQEDADNLYQWEEMEKRNGNW